MKFFIPILIIAIGLASSSHTYSQDAAAKAVEEVKKASKSPEIKSILYNPRLRNAVRSVTNNPAKALKSITDNPDEAVQSATAILQSELKKNGTSVDEMTNKAKQAAKKLSNSSAQMLDKPATKDVPAVRRPAAIRPATTRSAVTAAAKPLPIGNSDSLAPNAGIIETDTPARPVEPGNALAMLVMGKAIPSEIPNSNFSPDNDIPSPKSLQQKYSTKQESKTYHKGATTITARKSHVDLESNKITFSGDVFINDDANGVTMKCDKLQIYLVAKGKKAKNVKGKPTQLTKAIASGGMVQIKKVADGKTQTALARRIDYNAITLDAILSGGPPSIREGDTSIQTKSQDSKIILRGNGKYEIIGSDRHTIIVPLKGGKKLSKDLDSSGGGFNKIR